MNQSVYRSGGEVLVDGLIRYGVKTAFCVPGESYLAALDAFYDRQTQIQLISCRQEGGAAYMAEATGKLEGIPGVCFVSRGPGAANAMVGVHTAFQDSTPMLMFIGQVSREDAQREAFQELDYQQVYGAVAKRVIRIDRAQRIPELLQQAWNVAVSGRPGPVVVELPEDMLVEKTDVCDVSPQVVFQGTANPDAMEKIRGWLNAAKRPMVICGGAGWTKKASDYLRTFSENWAVAVVTSFRRSDSFSHHHPYYAGELGLAPNPELVKAAQSSDLLLVIGPRLGDMTTGGYQHFPRPGGSRDNHQTLVHIHIAPEEINRVFSADLGVVSQPEACLSVLCGGGIDPASDLATSRKDWIKGLRQSYLSFLQAPRNTEAVVRMDKIAEFLRSNLPPNTIIANGAGNYTTWSQRHYQFSEYGTQLASTNGSMGYGVPAAVAAKLARPDRMVVSFSGDGCFMMNGQELATAVQYNLNILFLIINNGVYGTIQKHQQHHYPNRPIATILTNPDFAALARSYGAFGETIERTDQFKEVYYQASAFEGPALIEIKTDYY